MTKPELALPKSVEDEIALCMVLLRAHPDADVDALFHLIAERALAASSELLDALATTTELLKAAKETLDYFEMTEFCACGATCECIVGGLREAIAKVEGR